jgi:hypothetical protein
MIAGQITAPPAFLEVYMDANQLFYRPITADESASEEKARRRAALQRLRRVNFRIFCKQVHFCPHIPASLDSS